MDFCSCGRPPGANTDFIVICDGEMFDGQALLNNKGLSMEFVLFEFQFPSRPLELVVKKIQNAVHSQCTPHAASLPKPSFDIPEWWTINHHRICHKSGEASMNKTPVAFNNGGTPERASYCDVGRLQDSFEVREVVLGLVGKLLVGVEAAHVELHTATASSADRRH